ncbi:MAG TPA: endonuclease/exonuclease/phosphatase family protein [Longimicrobiales bacterium]
MRLLACSLALIAALGCQRSSGPHAPFAELQCKLGNVIGIELPKPSVTLVADTTTAMAAWRSSAGEAIVDRTGRSCDVVPLDSILVISWNTHLGHADMRAFVADLRAGRVVPGTRINHFVMLVQEAYREGESVPANVTGNGCTRRMGGEGHDIEDIADSLGLALFYVSSMRNGCSSQLRQDRGNAILSTLPLAHLKAIELPLVRQRRVAAMAEVSGRTTDGRDWNLVVASVHLENRGSGGPRSWVRGRARQAEALVANLPDSVLLAVGGDLNTLTGPDEPAVEIIGRKFTHSPEHQHRNTFLSYVVMRSHLDYLFFRCYGRHKSTYWRANDRYGSDHYPIMGFVRVG